MYWYLNRKRIPRASGGGERYLRLLGVRTAASRWPHCLRDVWDFNWVSSYLVSLNKPRKNKTKKQNYYLLLLYWERLNRQADNMIIAKWSFSLSKQETGIFCWLDVHTSVAGRTLWSDWVLDFLLTVQVEITPARMLHFTPFFIAVSAACNIYVFC